ncbi:hypothetical protein [Martelella soudanensis]|uniref:hypothetical protein n=1 Tax=unclassified Martelella TaxID=2629616 RepID=UPI0015DD61F5|nr:MULTISPECIES: hypothetical protein [unclassified Martelella]
MPEGYLTSSDIKMIAGFMDEVRRKNILPDTASVIVFSRMLIRIFEARALNREELLDVLGDYLQVPDRKNSALDRWDSEGGAIPVDAIHNDGIHQIALR